MNLTDTEILELNELCGALVDGVLTKAQHEQLSQLLASSAEARQLYIRALGLSASLYHYASEMQADEMDAVGAPARGLGPLFSWWLGGLAVTASVALLLLIGGQLKQGSLLVESKADEFVARLTASKGCEWAAGAVQPNNSLARGQRLELAKGFAEITFDSGARVVLEGPASLDITSAWGATLHQGTLKANVPLEAIGFVIASPSVEVLDLGTEFTMIAYASGAADVLVLKGAVEATLRETDTEHTVVLREKEARSFTADGVSAVSDSVQKFAHSAQTVTLDHFVPATEYVRWSFDEADGNVLRADARGVPVTAFDAHLHMNANSGIGPTPVRTEGRWQRALQFDGNRYAKAAFPGISGSSPHTVAFWVKVPEDAPLSDAYAIIAWDTNCKKLNLHPVHISWNRRPTEGAVGVLRTDYGGGFALGATPLRDGRWHHVAVVFAPGEDDKYPPEVKLYVDGRFEGEGKSSPKGDRKTPAVTNGEDATIQTDVVWFGRRLGHERQRKDRFRGEIDELFIADRALGPGEIVHLMKYNQPPPVELATAKE